MVNPHIKFSNVSKYYTKIPESLNIKNKILYVLKGYYNKHYALKNVSFEIKRGEKVALLGPNGSGKSTTMKLLSGIITPSNGVISVNNYFPQNRQVNFLKSIGLLAGQKSHLWWDLPAIDSFKLIKAIYEISDQEYKSTLDFLVDSFKIHALIYKQVRKLSLGERMKMELTLTLLHKPQILFLDEPTIGLDYKAQQSIIEILNKYNQEFGITIILTSHYLKDIENLCDRVIILKHGTKIFDDSLKTLKSEYACYYNLKIVTDKIDNNLLGNDIRIIESTKNSYVLRIEKKNLRNIINILNHNNLTEFVIEDASIEDALETFFNK